MPWQAILRGAVVVLKIGIILLPIIERVAKSMPKRLPG